MRFLIAALVAVGLPCLSQAEMPILANCHKAAAQNPWNKKLPKTLTYLTELKNFIAQANPQIFNENFQAQDLCLDIDLSSGLAATAIPYSGRISFHPLYLLDVQSEPALAATMSHEIAHVVLRHAVDKNFRNRVHPLAAKDAELQNLRVERVRLTKLFAKNIRQAANQLREILGLSAKTSTSMARLTRYQNYLDHMVYVSTFPNHSEIPKQRYDVPRDFVDIEIDWDNWIWNFQREHPGVNLDELLKAVKQNEKLLNAIFARYQEFTDREIELVGDREAAIWPEIEAEEVGLEYYLRTGLKPESYWGRVEKNLKPKELKACLEKIRTGEVVEKQVLETGRHPSACWVMQHLSKTQFFKITEAKPKLQEKLNTLEKIPGLTYSFEEVKAEISQLIP